MKECKALAGNNFSGQCGVAGIKKIIHMQVLRKIGQGGFGAVDEVLMSDGQRLARKTFLVNQMIDESFIPNLKRRFSQEVRIQKQIINPNIVPVLYDFLENDPPYYFMPLAEGSLDVDLGRSCNLNNRFLSALSDIASGLECMHAMGIFHRDLKPQNVLRFSKDGTPFYAVSDFGLVSMQESRLSRLTVTGMAKGSDHYTAPEITQDLRNASVQSDIFSFGCILHDMIGNEPRVPCAEIDESGPYAAILRGCTRRHPGRRFQTVRAVLDAVASVSSVSNVPLSPSSRNFIERIDSTDRNIIGFWEEVYHYLDRDGSDDEKEAIFLKISESDLEFIFSNNYTLANNIGEIFTNWVESGAFGFDFCDVIASKLQVFFRYGHITTRSNVLMALLILGTSHNRWHVERMFARLCSPSMDPDLAARFSIDLRVKGERITSMFSHLERSIGCELGQFHPRIVETVSALRA